MTWRSRTAARRGASWAAAGVAALGLAACSRAVPLVPGEAVEGELEPGGKAEYRLDLGGEAYARLHLAPQPIDGVVGEVTVRVLAKGGRLIAEAVCVREPSGGLVAWVGEAGRYRIDIENTGTGVPAAFRLELEERRAARAGDRYRAAAVRDRAEADRLAAGSDREAVRAALERSLDNWLRVGETDSAVEVLLAMVAFDQTADPDAALARCEQALELSARSGLAPRQIQALNWKGTILLRREDCPAALSAYDRAREIARSANEPSWGAEIAYSIAVLRRRCAKDQSRARLSPEVVAAYDEAIAAARRASHTSIEAQSYLDLAAMAKQAGDYESARRHIDRAWELARRSGDPMVEADVAHELGNLNRRQGRLAEALESFQRCLRLNEELGRSHLLPGVLLSLGALALELRRPEEAWSYNQRALRAAESSGDPVRQSEALVELGAVLHRQEDYPRAEEFFRRALATAERLEAGKARTRRIAAARFRLGSALLAEGRPLDAVVELTSALEAQREIEDLVGEAQTRQVLGTARGRLGDTVAATEQLSAALALNEKLGDPLRTVGILYHLAEVQVGEDPQRARATLEEAIAIGQRVRAGLSVDPLRAGFSEAPRRLYELYVDLLVSTGDLEAAFVASEEARARALLDLLVEARIDLAEGVAPNLHDELQSINERIAVLQLKLNAIPAVASDKQIAPLRAQIERAEQQWWRTEAAIRSLSPRYDELRAPPIASVAQVQAGLPPSRALLEYWLGDETAYVFVLTRRVVELVRLPAAERIETEVAALRAAALALEPASQYAATAQRLYRDLLAPALAAARSAGEPIHELVIVPDGALHLVPFEALVTATPPAGARFEDLAYLLREVSISYAPSVSVLTSLERGRAVPGAKDSSRPGLRFLAFADPRYEPALAFDCPEMGRNSTESVTSVATVRSQRLRRLAGSRSEVAAIETRYGRQARAYYGAAASEERVKTDPELAAAERVHFAVHGVVCESLPERSGLVFARGGGREDGFLQTREVFGLELSADLVVLSACETGLGRLVSGEGMVGLARAFFYAGTPSLVVSLWRVSDRSTERLMTSFYEQLDLGMDKATALQRARLALIEAGGPDAAPFYWAPFVLLGSRGAGPPATPM